MGYRCLRKINSDYFIIGRSYGKEKRDHPDLDYFTNGLKTNDYYIYKSTGRFKEVSTKEFFDFKYAGYFFFNKKLYEKNWIDLWIEWTNKNSNFLYLGKPFPPYLPKKIKIY